SFGRESSNWLRTQPPSVRDTGSSPATRVENELASKERMGPTALRPSANAPKNGRVPIPKAETTPTPVITASLTRAARGRRYPFGHQCRPRQCGREPLSWSGEDPARRAKRARALRLARPRGPRSRPHAAPPVSRPKLLARALPKAP